MVCWEMDKSFPMRYIFIRPSIQLSSASRRYAMIRRLADVVVLFFVLISFLCSGVSSAEIVAPSKNGETAAIEELYRLELLPALHAGETCKMFSSYDRTGGNDDGFAGTYSKLRVEDGNSVLAEMDGPGCIQRIWFTHSEGVSGLLNRKNEHIRIYLDGEKTPALDVPLEDIFSGKLEGFPKPLVGESQGGFYCYVPIPYKKSCKVMVDGTGVRFYQIGYRTFASDRGLDNYRYPPTAAQKESLAAAAKAWSNCGDLRTLGIRDARDAAKSEKPFSLKAGETMEFALPEGPNMVRAVAVFEPAPSQNADFARLQIRWDDASTPAVDLPLSFFFCLSKQPSEFKSLLAGSAESWYNFLPMPYRQSGKVTIKAEKPISGSLLVWTAKMDSKPDSLGYLHAVYNESLPTQTGKFHAYLDRKGKGKFVGVYLATDGQTESKLPQWLEGDEQFTCDGELRIHGTGTEDGFNCGWYALQGRLNGPGAAPLSGFPVYRMEDQRNIATAFRWYLTDPVAYEKSIQAELEHGPTNDLNANYRTAAFFYDVAP
jgi:hypothetical protein